MKTPTAFEWHNYETGHCYVEYVPHVDGKSNILDEKNGYTKIPLYAQQPQKVEQEAKPNKRIMKNIFHVGFMACHGGMELKEANKWFDKTYKIEEEEKPTKRMKSE